MDPHCRTLFEVSEVLAVNAGEVAPMCFDAGGTLLLFLMGVPPIFFSGNTPARLFKIRSID